MERMSDERLAEWKAIRAELYGSGPWADDLEEFYLALKAERAEAEQYRTECNYYLQRIRDLSIRAKTAEQEVERLRAELNTAVADRAHYKHAAEKVTSRWAATEARAQAAEALLDEIAELPEKWRQYMQGWLDVALDDCADDLDAIFAKRERRE